MLQLVADSRRVRAPARSGLEQASTRLRPIFELDLVEGLGKRSRSGSCGDSIGLRAPRRAESRGAFRLDSGIITLSNTVGVLDKTQFCQVEQSLVFAPSSFPSPSSISPLRHLPYHFTTLSSPTAHLSPPYFPRQKFPPLPYPTISDTSSALPPLPSQTQNKKNHTAPRTRGGRRTY